MDDHLAFDFLPSPRAELGESPAWSTDENCLWWVDIVGRRVFRTDISEGKTRTWTTPEMTGIVAASAGGAVIGMETGLFHLDPLAGRFERITALDAQGVRFNDATVDSTGRLWAATMEFDYSRPVGVLYRIEPDFSMSEAIRGFFIPNGLAVDEERRRLFFSDSHPDLQTVWVADLDLHSGNLGERRVFARFQDFRGRPDGAAIDASGNYWIAGVGGACLHVFSPAGEHIAEYEVPVDNPTKIAFGGAGRSQLFLTSKADQGEGGRLTVAQTGMKGRNDRLFGLRPRNADRTVRHSGAEMSGRPKDVGSEKGYKTR